MMREGLTQLELYGVIDHVSEAYSAVPGHLEIRVAIAAIVDALRAIVDSMPCASEPVAVPSVELAGERVEIRVPDARDAAKVTAFDQIAAFVGMAGREASSANASALLREVANIVGRVHGVPSPMAADTERHYRRVAADRLTPKQLRLVGLGDAS
ncbi:hypothetical protein [Pseudomonas sp.]|uniref:hypothetical protein n=1 Tax=Pseudomonas sp. TaxID=306 RepID=UPI002610F5B0|nr:hypothetical protein [Pseudomonas sp.]